jgi:hypothetical protein
MTNSQTQLLAYLTHGSVAFFSDLSAVFEFLALEWFKAGKTSYSKVFAECAALLDQITVKVSALEESFQANGQDH